MTADTVTAPEADAEAPAEATEPSEAGVDRGQRLTETRKAKMDALYQGQHYRVEAVIALTEGRKFVTPFGNKGSHGFLLKNDNAEATGEQKSHIIGASVLQQVAETYGAVELPAKARKRRTAEEKAADDVKAKADREAKKQAKAAERAAKVQAKADAAAAERIAAAEEIERQVAEQRAQAEAASATQEAPPETQVVADPVFAGADEAEDLLSNV